MGGATGAAGGSFGGGMTGWDGGPPTTEGSETVRSGVVPTTGGGPVGEAGGRVICRASVPWFWRREAGGGPFGAETLRGIAAEGRRCAKLPLLLLLLLRGALGEAASGFLGSVRKTRQACMR